LSAGDAIWPVPGDPDVGLDIPIDDLLAHLTEFWKPLMLRQVYPIDVNPPRPSDTRAEAMKRWAELPPEVVEREEANVSAFEECHNLASAFAGLFDLPAFWLLRARDQMICETGGRVRLIPFTQVRRALEDVGNRICEILLEVNSERWERVAEAWRRRDAGNARVFLAWSTGMSSAVVDELVADRTLATPDHFEDVLDDNDELWIAARMSGALPLEQVRQIIALARGFEKRKSNSLRSLSKDCANQLNALTDKRPFAQGEAAAHVAREHLLASADKGKEVDIFGLVVGLGVEVKILDVPPSTLDGLAIWGTKHGPGVLLNEASSRIRRERGGEGVDKGGARVTLAHELCHLLLDGARTVSAVDVLRSRMPLSIEQRAKAFAGEFLLPSKLAADAWDKAGRPRRHQDLEPVVEDLAQRFGVTRSVASWKLEHGVTPYNVDLTAVLYEIAPRR